MYTNELTPAIGATVRRYSPERCASVTHAIENTQKISVRNAFEIQKYSVSETLNSGGCTLKKLMYVTCVAISAAHVNSSQRCVRWKMSAITATVLHVMSA